MLYRLTYFLLVYDALLDALVLYDVFHNLLVLFLETTISIGALSYISSKLFSYKGNFSWAWWYYIDAFGFWNIVAIIFYQNALQKYFLPTILFYNMLNV